MPDSDAAESPLPDLSRVVVHLARSRDFPEGSAQHGYEIVAPLDAEGHLDAEAWKRSRKQCRVRRFWAGEPDQEGLLVHRSGGAEGATWVIDYEQDSSDDDEAGYRLGGHRFEEGEYVSIRDDDGHMNTFRVVRVEPA